MNIVYLWSKFIKKIPLSAIKDSVFEKPSKVEARSTVVKTSMGRYSYCGYGCTLINCSIGRFCSIADNVIIGIPNHPMDWVSTSCAFYRGKDSIPKDLAKLDYNTFPEKTIIGNDVWIGRGAYIKQGIKIGDGAVIGMGSVVTKDVLPYSVVAGVPARHIKYRFNSEMIKKMEDIKWWDYEISDLKDFTQYFNDPKKFVDIVGD